MTETSPARLREAAMVLREQPGDTDFGNALADWLTAASVAEQHPTESVVDKWAHAVAEVILTPEG